jgi:hypothetical protein
MKTKECWLKCRVRHTLWAQLDVQCIGSPQHASNTSVPLCWCAWTGGSRHGPHPKSTATTSSTTTLLTSVNSSIIIINHDAFASTAMCKQLAVLGDASWMALSNTAEHECRRRARGVASARSQHDIHIPASGDFHSSTESYLVSWTSCDLNLRAVSASTTEGTDYSEAVLQGQRP